MNRMHSIRRVAVTLAGLAGALLAFCAGSVPVLASTLAPLGGDPHGHPGRPLPPVWDKHPPLPAHTMATGGMPGWQVLVLAAGAVVLAALTVIVYRKRTARRRVTVSAA
jgi:hypothetical protein